MAYTLLTVDDSSTIRAMIAKTLRLAGIDVSVLHEAANGEEALKILKSRWIDLVFSDLNMPGMSGFELVERMRSDALLESIPVVIVSSVSSRATIEDLRIKGIRAYLTKPFKPEEARKVIADLLGATHADPAR